MRHSAAQRPPFIDCSLALPLANPSIIPTRMVNSVSPQRAAEKSARHLLEAIGGLREAAGSSFWKYAEICGREGLSKSSLHLMRNTCGSVGEDPLELRLHQLVEKLTSAGIIKAHAECIVYQRCVSAARCTQAPPLARSVAPASSAGEAGATLFYAHLEELLDTLLPEDEDWGWAPVSSSIAPCGILGRRPCEQPEDEDSNMPARKALRSGQADQQVLELD